MATDYLVLTVGGQTVVLSIDTSGSPIDVGQTSLLPASAPGPSLGGFAWSGVPGDYWAALMRSVQSDGVSPFNAQWQSLISTIGYTHTQTSFYGAEPDASGNTSTFGNTAHGMPINQIAANTPTQSVTFWEFPDTTDPGPIPLLQTMAIDGWPGAASNNGDNAVNGTVAVTNGSASVVGTGTNFTASGSAVVGAYFDSFVSGLPPGLASSAVVTPFPWNGTSSGTFTGGTYSIGAIEESPHQPGAYSCRISVLPSALPFGTTPRVSWSVGGSAVVDPSPQPPSVLLDGGLSWGQAINQILAGVAGRLLNVPNSGPGTLGFYDPTGTTVRIAMAVDGSGNRTSITHTLPVA